ncbi:MAG: biopolymer transporter ExbD [Polyangiaceae bacterium]|nr:biopolymer transporter ExbD [Polyangiaceae bacterium]
MSPRALILTPLLVSLALACGGGGEKATKDSASAKPATTAAPPKTTSSAATKTDEMPPVTVDDLGPFINGQRANLKEQDGPAKLKKVIGDLPIKGKEVPLVILKKAKIPDVLAVVKELGAAGAPSVKIKVGEGRGDLPKEFSVVPQAKLADKPPACAVVAMVSKNLATDVWAITGGTGKRHVKGFAGPDLSNTGETLKKAIKKCDSKVAFFSADESLDWELAHMIGGAILANDEEKKLTTLVLLDEAPVPGRPVKGF